MRVKNLIGLICLVYTTVRALYNKCVRKQAKIAPEKVEYDERQHRLLSTLGYTIGSKLGEGSFSLVVKAHSQKHHRYVAIKIITRKKVPKIYSEKFLPRELELIKGLRHKNIVKFLNITETNKCIYIIMNLASNGNLLEAIRKNGYIDEPRSCFWFHHLTDGIAYCHSKGIVHRDLKCENLLLDESNILKITDFSFARAKLPLYIINDEENVNRSVELSSTFCGSYAYACPEILLQKPYEPHLSDTWSMGVVLYAMLSGRLPFDDTNYHNLIRQVKSPVRFIPRPSISFSAKNLILKILSPARIRIYIPKIRKDTWYKTAYQSCYDKDLKRISTVTTATRRSYQEGTLTDFNKLPEESYSRETQNIVE